MNVSNVKLLGAMPMVLWNVIMSYVCDLVEIMVECEQCNFVG